jgi:hypothetical protein
VLAGAGMDGDGDVDVRRRTLLGGGVTGAIGVGMLALPSAAAASSFLESPRVSDATSATSIHTGRPTANLAGTVSSHALADGSPTGDAGVLGDPLVTDAVRGLAADTTHVYWSASLTNRLGRIRHDGTGLEPAFVDLATLSVAGYSPSAPFGVAVSSTHLYWVEQGQQRIGRAALDGSSVEPLWRTGLPHRAESLALTSTHLYFAEFRAGSVADGDDQPVSRLALAGGAGGSDGAGGTVEQLLTRRGGDGSSGSQLTPGTRPAAPSGLVTTATHLYVVTRLPTSGGTGAEEGWVSRCRLDGSAFTSGWGRAVTGGSVRTLLHGDADATSLHLCTSAGRTVRATLAETPEWSEVVTTGAFSSGLTLAPRAAVPTVSGA